MKIHRNIAVLVLTCFLPTAAFGGNLPYIPDIRDFQDFQAASSPIVAFGETLANTNTLILASRFSGSTSDFVGDFAEALMRNYYSSGADLSATKTWYSLEHGNFAIKNGSPSYKPGAKQGFDGLFMQFDADGNPSGIMAVESKFGNAKLRKTSNSGKQMSDVWVRDRTKATAIGYREMADNISKNGITLTKNLPNSIENITEIPISNRETALLWQRNGHYYLYSENETVSVEDLKISIRKIEQILQGAADGKIVVRKILLKVGVVNNKFQVKLVPLDNNANEIPGKEQIIKTLSGGYASLSPQNQKLIRESVIEAIRLQKYKFPNGDKIAVKDFDLAVKQNKVEDFIKKYNVEKPRFAWDVAGKTSLTAGLYGGGLALAFSLTSKLWATWVNGEDFDYIGIAKDTGLGFASASVGTMAGMGVNYLIQSSSQATLNALSTLGVTEILGGTASGLIASAIFSYGHALLSGGSFRDGNRMMLTGTAATAVGALASWGIGSAVSLWNAANTVVTVTTVPMYSFIPSALVSYFPSLGTSLVTTTTSGFAIGTMGTTILVTGGTMAVAMAVTALGSYGWSLLDENSRMERLHLLIDAYEKYY